MVSGYRTNFKRFPARCEKSQHHALAEIHKNFENETSFVLRQLFVALTYPLPPPFDAIARNATSLTTLLCEYIDIKKLAVALAKLFQRAVALSHLNRDSAKTSCVISLLLYCIRLCELMFCEVVFISDAQRVVCYHEC